MTKSMLSTEELEKLKRLGDVLVPPSDKMPGFSAVSEIDRLLQTAAIASGYTQHEITAAFHDLPVFSDLAGAKGFAEAAPVSFDLLARLVSGSYYMAREVLVALNYPLERRNPAGVSDFADEYMTGIVDPVIENRRGAA